MNGTKSGVVCWGKNDNGQLGIGNRTAMEAQYLAIVDLGDGERSFFLSKRVKSNFPDVFRQSQQTYFVHFATSQM